MTDSTIGDTTSVVSVQSSVSTRSSRSGLTRQGNPPAKGDTGGCVKKKEDRRSFKQAFNSLFCHRRVNIQASELREQVGKRQDKEKTQKDGWRHPTARSEGAGCVALL